MHKFKLFFRAQFKTLSLIEQYIFVKKKLIPFFYLHGFLSFFHFFNGKHYRSIILLYYKGVFFISTHKFVLFEPLV